MHKIYLLNCINSHQECSENYDIEDNSQFSEDLVENQELNQQSIQNEIKIQNSKNITACSKCREPFWRCKKNECIRESVYKFNRIEIYGIFLVLIIMAATTATGVGGDIILIPIIKICFDFGSVESIALSQICTSISSFIRILVTYKNRNPYRNSPEIDYNVSLIFLPALFLGSNIGIVLSYILPSLLVSLLLFIVLLYSAYNSFNVGILLWQEELKNIKSDTSSNSSDNCNRFKFSSDTYYDDSIEEMSVLTINDVDIKNRLKNARNHYSSTSLKDSETRSVYNKYMLPIEKIITSEKEYVNWDKVKYICITLFVMILSTVCTGTKDMKSLLGLGHCTRVYWILYILFIVYFCFMIRVCINHVYNEYNVKTTYGYNFNSYDMKWNQGTINMMIVFAVLCGILSSVAGIGGGIIYAPFLLAINLHPNVSTSTATLFNFFSSLSNAILAILSNQVYYEYAIWLVVWTCMGTILGFYLFKDLIERTHKTSTVVFLLVAVLLFATFMTIVNDFREMDVDINHPGKSLSLGSYCSS